MGFPPRSEDVENPSSFFRAYNTRSGEKEDDHDDKDDDHDNGGEDDDYDDDGIQHSVWRGGER